MKLSKNSISLSCEISVDGTIKDVNFNFQKVSGGSRDDILGSSFYEYIHLNDFEATDETLKTVVLNKSSITFLSRFKAKSGDYRLIRWELIKRDISGNIFLNGSYISQPMDSSEKQKPELKKHTDQFQNSYGIVFIHDLSGNFLYMDKNVTELLGFHNEELLSMNIYDILSRAHKAFGRKYLGDLESSGEFGGTVTVKHKNGQSLILNIKSKVNHDQFDKPLISGMAKDITKRHHLWKEFNRQASQLSKVNNMARIGEWELDLTTSDLKWSEITRQIFGVDNHYEPSTDKELLFYKTDESRELMISALREALLNGKGWDMQLELLSTSGKEVWIRSIGVTELQNGRCLQIYGIVQDISDSKALELSLVVAKKDAEIANSAKSEFLANMSHEIRTPLNGVIGFTDLLLQTELNETQKQYLSVVMQSGNALLNTINDILDFSKIEAGKLEINESKINLHQLVEESSDVIKYQVQNKGLEMLLKVPSDLPKFVWADEIRLKQILINLLSNAVKFTHYGEVELSIEVLSNPELEDILYRFSVRDTGIGIQPDKKEKIFDAFSQEDTSTTKKYGGTGLGLTISNNLLELMNSRLQVDSKPGIGSVFFFEITLKSDMDTNMSDVSFDMIKSVLIVDDNGNNRQIINQMLSLKKLVCEEASGGWEAIDLIKSGREFDIILMDYHMPELDGLATIKEIRKIPSFRSDIPIVLLHSTSDDRVFEECQKLKIKYRLLKPVTLKLIYGLLSDINSQKSLSKTAFNTQTEPLTEHLEVLIAEDNLVNMLLAKTIVKRIAPNAAIHEAKNGLEAINVCKDNHIDIILMDIQMPQMNGYEATKRIRALQDYSNTPIFALTAGNVKGEREKSLAVGMNDFITKPVIANTVLLSFKRWLRPTNESSGPDVTEPLVPAANIDLTVLNGYVGNDPEVLHEILTLLNSNYKGFLQEFDKFVLLKDLVKIHQLFTKIYDTSITLGLTNLIDLIVIIQNSTSFNNISGDAWNEIRDEMVMVINFLSNYDTEPVSFSNRAERS
jgi:PAS domain S-box-containing protein